MLYTFKNKAPLILKRSSSKNKVCSHSIDSRMLIGLLYQTNAFSKLTPDITRYNMNVKETPIEENIELE